MCFSRRMTYDVLDLCRIHKYRHHHHSQGSTVTSVAHAMRSVHGDCIPVAVAVWCMRHTMVRVLVFRIHSEKSWILLDYFV